MEKYERYRRYKFSKAFNSNMNTVTFNNLYTSINNGDIENVAIVHYRTANFLHVIWHSPGIPAAAIFLNNATINSNIASEVLIEGHHGILRILFNSAEEKLFFLNEIERYLLINNY